MAEAIIQAVTSDAQSQKAGMKGEICARLWRREWRQSAALCRAEIDAAPESQSTVIWRFNCSDRWVCLSLNFEAADGPVDLQSKHVTLSYAWSEEGHAPETVRETLHLVFTRLHFGGQRPWILCRGCQRRCRILYGGSRFRCRLCWRAKYQSQYESPLIRISGRRWKIREKLEVAGGEPWDEGSDDGFPEKPPWIHWRTYARLAALDELLAER